MVSTYQGPIQFVIALVFCLGLSGVVEACFGGYLLWFSDLVGTITSGSVLVVAFDFGLGLTLPVNAHFDG